MVDDRHRLRRAQMLLRLRTAERTTAIADAAEAQEKHGKLADVARRTLDLAAHYRTRLDRGGSGADLAASLIMIARVGQMSGAAAAQSSAAGARAEAALASVAQAERRRQRAAKDCRTAATERQLLADRRE